MPRVRDGPAHPQEHRAHVFNFVSVTSFPHGTTKPVSVVTAPAGSGCDLPMPHVDWHPFFLLLRSARYSASVHSYMSPVPHT